jgi:photosystem II stability/assembly factor-like uncharacterized protein
MKTKHISLLVLILFALTMLISCSDDESSPLIPPAINDTADFTNLSSRIPGTAYSKILTDIEIIGNKFWITSADWNLGMFEVIISTDSGKTFTSVPLGVMPYSICMFPDGINGWIAAHGAILRTSDGGFSWSASYTFNGAATQISFPNTQYGYISGSINTGGIDSKAALFKTSNSGANWIIDTISNSMYNAYTVCAPNPALPDIVYFGAFISGTGNLYISSDFGITWIKQTTVPVNHRSTKLIFTNYATGWIVGNQGFMNKFENGIWVSKTISSALNYSDIAFTPDGINGWALSSANDSATYAMFQTTDGGASWTRLYQYFTIWYPYSVEIVSSTEAYFVGYGSTFIRYKKVN